ncbi:MAG: carbon-nitrogen hydrolase family protein [Nevskiaceae bacterium]|nr:MAG: carbon-nitrogen hydrolase family protein [Nevskiaceae bacterium]
MNTVAAIQMNSGADVAANLATARRLLQEARAGGAVLAVLPENFAFMGAHETDKLAHAEPLGAGPIQSFLAAAARELGLWIVAGTLPLAAPGQSGKVLAASLVFDDAGRCVAHYDKIHLFDVSFERDGRTESYRESNSIAFGAVRPTLSDTPAGRLGLSVCYDLRFPELYRALAADGARLLCVPSAFTDKTGEAHWEILLRARAVENFCFVIAPNQSGTHAGGRRTWGHSMIVGPWGEVLAQRADGEGVVLAPIDAAAQEKIRQSFPSLQHRRL